MTHFLTVKVAFARFLVIDAQGKIPSGLAEMNTNWLGSWDECWDIEARTNRFVVAGLQLFFFRPDFV